MLTLVLAALLTQGYGGGAQPCLQSGAWSVSLLNGGQMIGRIQLVGSDQTTIVDVDNQQQLKVVAPLPIGASTEAKQPALGIPGNPATDVISVQGVGAGQPVIVSAGALPLPANAAQESSGNLETIAGKDFATQATLALIKAKTDNLDVALSSRSAIASTQPVSGTFWQETQPVSAASLPLPSGASTAAKQPALGTAGTASADVISVQGVASMTALKVDGSAVTQPVSGTFWQSTQPVSAASLPLPAGAATETTQLLQATEATLALVKAKTDNLDVLLSTRTKPEDTQKVDGSAVTQPVSGTFWQATQPVSGTVTANQGGTWTVQPGNTANTTAWKVDGSAVTQPVSGTFWQTTQPVSGTVTANQGGTWTVQPGNTANTTAWKVDGSAVTQPVSGTFWQATQPVSATSLPLPTGASTSAKQPALGTAGSPATDVISIQGVASGTVVPVSGTFWQATQPVSAASLPLPTGAATETTQLLQATETTLAGRLKPADTLAGVTTVSTVTSITNPISGRNDLGTAQSLAVAGTGALYVVNLGVAASPLPRLPCNRVRRFNCQP